MALTPLPITEGGEVEKKRKRKKERSSERTERGGNDWATVWEEREEGLRKYELVYD